MVWKPESSNPGSSKSEGWRRRFSFDRGREYAKSVVSEHYAKLGFVKVAADGPGTRWALDLGAYVAPALPMILNE